MGQILKAIGSFAQGYADEKRRQAEEARKKELHDLQVQRMRDEKAMTEEIKKVNELKVAPSEAYVVNGVTYADPKQAHDAAAAASGAEIKKKILVGDKQFDTPEDAANAAEAMNSALAKSRMAAQIALKYNRPDVFEAHMKSYKMGVEANRADMMETIMAAKATGDPTPALEAYNKRLPNGKTAELIKGADGQLALQVVQNGQPVGAPRPVGTLDNFFNSAIEFVNTTPENALEVWKHKSQLEMQGRGLDIQQKGVDIQGRVADSNIKKTDAEVAQMPEEMGLKRQQVKAAQTSASAAATSASASVINAQTNREEMTRPKVYTGVNDKNEVSVFQASPTKGKDGVYGLSVSKPQVVPGVLPTGMAKPDSLGLGMPQAPQLNIDWSKLPPKK